MIDQQVNIEVKKINIKEKANIDIWLEYIKERNVSADSSQLPILFTEQDFLAGYE